MRAKKTLKWTAIGVGALVLVAGTFICIKIGPRNVIGMLRYDQREEGTLKVGDRAPDVSLIALDGTSRVKLGDSIGQQPLVLVFGSFT